MTENACFSGGAVGADLAWGDAAKKVGHRVIHYTFKGHKESRHPDAVVLDKNSLSEADETMVRINEQVLHRAFPCHSEFVTNLIRRNFFQIKDAESVYAVATLDGTTVSGGTAWAVEAFKIRNPNSTSVYVFDQDEEKWFQWNGYLWIEIESPPTPSGKWAGIGKRTINEAGLKAIKELME